MAININSKIDRFLDEGIVTYFYRMFVGDSGLTKDIFLANCMSNKLKILEEMPALRDTLQDGGDFTYDSLVKRIKDYSKTISTQPTSTIWATLKKDILAYFNPKMRIYPDLGALANQRSLDTTSGYLLNEQSKTLSYYDGQTKTQSVVCDFSRHNDAWNTVNLLFPKIFTNKSLKNSASLNPNQFMELINLVAAIDGNALSNFHIKNTTGFVALFDKIDQYAEYSVLLEKNKKNFTDPRSAEQFIEDTIIRMNERITDYLTKPKISDGTKAIMEGIQDYLTNGDRSQLDQAVMDHDRNWFSNLFYHNAAKRTLELVKIIEKSDFFKETIKKMQTNIGSTPSTSRKNSTIEPENDIEQIDFYFDDAPLDFHPDAITEEQLEEVKQKIDAFWIKQHVTKKSFLETLDKMQDYISTFKSTETRTLPEISVKNTLKYVDDDTNTNYSKETVIVHIENMIEQLRGTAKNLTLQSNFATLTGTLENEIHKILASTTDENNARLIIDAELRGRYIDIGIDLIDISQKTNKQVEKIVKVEKSVNIVRNEIHRLLSFYKDIEEHLRDYQNSAKQISQSALVRTIEDYVGEKGELSQIKNQLNLYQTQLSSCPDEKFDVTRPGDINQQNVVTIVNELLNRGTKFTDELKTLLLLDVDPNNPDNASNNERSYQTIHKTVDKDYREKFTELMQNIGSYTKTLNKTEKSELIDFFSPTGPTTENTLGLFRNKNIDSKIDAKIDDHYHQSPKK